MLSYKESNKLSLMSEVTKQGTSGSSNHVLVAYAKVFLCQWTASIGMAKISTSRSTHIAFRVLSSHLC